MIICNLFGLLNQAVSGDGVYQTKPVAMYPVK
jgi:hypothetical protein